MRRKPPDEPARRVYRFDDTVEVSTLPSQSRTRTAVICMRKGGPTSKLQVAVKPDRRTSVEADWMNSGSTKV